MQIQLVVVARGQSTVLQPEVQAAGAVGVVAVVCPLQLDDGEESSSV